MALKIPSKAVGYNWQTQQNFLGLPRFMFFAVPGFKIPANAIVVHVQKFTAVHVERVYSLGIISLCLFEVMMSR